MIEKALIPQSEQLLRVSEHWCLSRDGDPFAYELARRHYSARNYREQRQRLFVGPGRKLVLLSADGTALFVWRRFIDDTKPAQYGHNCALFRNEGTVLSSLLIKEAVGIVFHRWGLDRCYTLVNASKIRSSNPGCCFIKAGWRRCGTSKTGKLILEILPGVTSQVRTFCGLSPSKNGLNMAPGSFPKTEQLAETVPGCSQRNAAPEGPGRPEYKPLMRKPRAPLFDERQPDRDTAGNIYPKPTGCASNDKEQQIRDGLVASYGDEKSGCESGLMAKRHILKLDMDPLETDRRVAHPPSNRRRHSLARWLSISPQFSRR